MMKFLHSEGHLERFTSYMEKRRGRMEIEATRRRRGGIKRGESTLASNQFSVCSPQSGPLRDVHGVTQRRGRKETDVARRMKGGIKRRETDPASNHFLSVLHSPEQTDSQSQVEKKKGRGEIEVTSWRKKGESKWGESNQATDLDPK